MELDWLETFLAVVDQGGFTAAASQVHRSQSRVSAHIAALEREVGVMLIDRARRPAVLTAAGQVFANHAREILVDVGAARSAISVLKSMNQESLAVLTTPCIGASVFPGVIADVLSQHPSARVALSEHGWQDGERRHPADGYALAVLPTLSHPQPDGMQEHLLWREPLRAVLPLDHPVIRRTGRSTAASAHQLSTNQLSTNQRSGQHLSGQHLSGQHLSGQHLSPQQLSPQQLFGHPLVVSGMSMNAVPEVVTLLAARGLDASPRTTVDSPHTLVAMVRAGVGIGIANAIALDAADTTGLAVLDFDDPDMIREVAAYWYDELLTSKVGLSLHRLILQAPLPSGAVAIGADETGAVSSAAVAGAAG